MKRLCFLDMDGVLADFVVRICEAHNRPSPYTNADALGCFDIDALWGISARAFWKAADDLGAEFWSKMPKTLEADSIVELAVWAFGEENVAILTAPSSAPSCVPGKRDWVRRHYPKLADKIIFGSASAKRFLAGPGRFLVDDRDQNVEQFNKYGGTGVLVPRPWNNGHGNPRVMQALREGLIT